MDHDFVATLVFAHWPGMVSTAYDDLRRAARYSPVLGKFVTLEAFFKETEKGGGVSQFFPDEYEAGGLGGAVRSGEIDPISSVAAAARKEIARSAADSLSMMASMLRLEGSDARETRGFRSDDDPSNSAGTAGSLDMAARTFAKRLAVSSHGDRDGYLVMNPLSFARRVDVEATDTEFGVKSNNVIAADVSGGISRRVVELPAMGFAWLTGTETRARADQPRVNSKIAVENVLRNEFCEVAIHPETGGIQSIRDLRTHGNRLSQQLAIRMPQAAEGEDRAAYSTMVASSIAVEASDSVIGRIRSAGRSWPQTGKNWRILCNW